MRKLRNRREKGITLIALVVTIVVLIILATISINAVIGQGGIIEQAKRAKNVHDAGQSEEHTKLEEMANGIAKYYTDSNSDEAITVTVDGTEGIKLTKDNVADYLGRVVTNYKPTASTVTVGGTEYTVSTQYRLYYVDFDKKYGDEVSIFLKADCTDNMYALPTTDETSADASNVKIKELNPALYKTGVTSPTASNNNMKAVTFLTNTSNWNSLKIGASIENKVNYVVGAPSLEMMMDSYNTKYKLTGDKPNTRPLSESSERVKLFYRYSYNGNKYGYEVGPCYYYERYSGETIVQDYYRYTSEYLVKPDVKVGGMYCSEYNYWLSSPGTFDFDAVMNVTYWRMGKVWIYLRIGAVSASFSSIFSPLGVCKKFCVK